MGDRHSIASQPELITDLDEKARREAENGIRQFNLALEIIRNHVKDLERPFRLRPSTILKLHKTALDGIHLFAGTFRNTPVQIGGSKHSPVEPLLVSEEVHALCDYINQNWLTNTAINLSAYVLWKLNWIHPFVDGNGRTARATSYVVLSIKLDSLLPGSPTIPDQIAADKTPYYRALESADSVWRDEKIVDVSSIEAMLDSMLAKQLVNAARGAAGEQRTSRSDAWSRSLRP